MERKGNQRKEGVGKGKAYGGEIDDVFVVEECIAAVRDDVAAAGTVAGAFLRQGVCG